MEKNIELWKIAKMIVSHIFCSIKCSERYLKSISKTNVENSISELKIHCVIASYYTAFVTQINLALPCKPQFYSINNFIIEFSCSMSQKTLPKSYSINYLPKLLQCKGKNVSHFFAHLPICQPPIFAHLSKFNHLRT